jgi:hypothetical protein
MPLEKFQDCVSIKTLQKNFYFNISSILVAVITLSLLIVSQLAHNNFAVIVLLVLAIGFIGSIIGLYLSFLYSDRGDMVIINDEFEKNSLKQKSRNSITLLT